MKIDKNYDPQAHFLEVQKRIQTELGEPVSPSWDEVSKDWKLRAKYRPPRSFMFVMDIRTNNSILAAGMNLLGYEDNKLLAGEDFINLTHENQRRLLKYQTLSLYSLFFNEADTIYGKDVVYCTSRGIKDTSGKYHLVYQTATPFQYDKNGVIVRYSSFYQILGEYKGQALETDIFTNPLFPDAQKRLRKSMREVKERIIEGLGFTRTQKQIIDVLASRRLKKQEVADSIGIATRTLEGHRLNIIEKARDAFPLNNFNNAEDVILYLEQQGII